MRIEISGALATGKTTLVNELKAYGYDIVYEDLSTNPYLDLVKQDPEKYALLCQQTFVSDKINGLKAASQRGGRILSDYSLATDAAYIQYYLADKPEWIEILTKQLGDGLKEIGKPDLIIHLICPPEEQLRRIAARGRAFEQGHTKEFVQTIGDLMDGMVDAQSAAGVKVLKVNTTGIDYQILARAIHIMAGGKLDIKGPGSAPAP